MSTASMNQFILIDFTKHAGFQDYPRLTGYYGEEPGHLVIEEREHYTAHLFNYPIDRFDKAVTRILFRFAGNPDKDVVVKMWTLTIDKAYGQKFKLQLTDVLHTDTTTLCGYKVGSEALALPVDFSWLVEVAPVK